MGRTLVLVIGGSRRDFIPRVQSRRHPAPTPGLARGCAGTAGIKKAPPERGCEDDGRDELFLSIYTGETFDACRPLGPWTTSN
jgi:hypothetical protein